MKLQRNNKYARRLTAGLGALVVSLGLLTCCNNTKNDAVMPTETPVVTETQVEVEEVVQTPEPTPAPLTISLEDPNYLSNYYKISDEEVSKRLKSLDIKNPSKTITMEKVGTLVLKDKNDDYKIIQTGEYTDYENNIVTLYDIFTEEVLCSISLNDMDYDIGNPDVSHCVYTNITPDMFTILNDSLNNYKIVEYGTVQYSTEFISKHFIELIDKYAPCVVDYTCNTWEQSFFLFPDEGVNYSDIEYPISKIAENYVINVPIEFQIASKELNLSSNNIENKYNDYDISDEELQDRISKLGIVNGNSIVNVDEVMTLVLEDSNKESKIVLAFISSQSGNDFALYDLFTDEFLCTFRVRENEKIQLSNNNRFINYDENDFYNKSELLNNYSIKQMGLYDYSLSYVIENIDYFRNRDGIDYQIINDPYYNVFPEGSNITSMSIEEYAEAYVTYTPEELQISCKELSNSNNKTLIKK